MPLTGGGVVALSSTVVLSFAGPGESCRKGAEEDEEFDNEVSFIS